jgi:hypothetical protein
MQQNDRCDGLESCVNACVVRALGPVGVHDMAVQRRD